MERFNETQRGPVVLNKLLEEDISSNISKGVIYLNEPRNSIGWWDGSNFEYSTFAEDIKTSQTTVSNTTDETEVLRFDLDSGALVTGRVFVLRVFGRYSTGGASDDFTFRIKVGEVGFDAQTGGDLITEVTTVQENVTDGPYQSKTTLTIRSGGQNGTMASHTEARFNNTPNDDHMDPSTINTETGEEVVATIQWNNAKVDNSVNIGQAYLQQNG